MDKLVLEIETLVRENSGSMEWSALINAVDYKDRIRVPDAIRISRSNGVLRRKLTFVDGVKNHTVEVQ